MHFCIQKVNNNSLILPNVGNFYSGNDQKNIVFESTSPIYQNTTGIDMAFRNARFLICQFYRIEGSMDDIYINQIIPIYQPHKKEPIAFQGIYLGQDYQASGYSTGNGLFWGSTTFSNGYYRVLPGFDAGALSDNFGLHKGRKGNFYAYIKSQQEPFKSAPMLQMYYYLGQPLLVARSSTGIVTNVFFQGRPSITNPMERAKKYLGKKWYNP
ncbi:hypothetical protein HOO68_04990 [Candidatus Gracilibacteria bacterium]|nr:hypothetical protein [Candidatus Gracilibacteria bacterium]